MARSQHIRERYWDDHEAMASIVVLLLILRARFAIVRWHHAQPVKSCTLRSWRNLRHWRRTETCSHGDRYNGSCWCLLLSTTAAVFSVGRHKTISMWDSFHGASLDCISVGGEAVFRFVSGFCMDICGSMHRCLFVAQFLSLLSKGVGPLLPGAEHVPPADEYRCLFGCQAVGRCVIVINCNAQIYT